MNDLKLSSIFAIAVLVIVVYFIAKYIVFPLLNLVLGIAAGIISSVFIVLIILLIYFYLKQAFSRK